MRPLVLFLSFCALASSLPAQLAFTDVTAASGITWFQTDSGQVMSAGAAFLDYDGDGWDDLLFAGGINVAGLFRSLGNGTFVHTTLAAGLHALPYQWEIFDIAVADYDNDGDPDLFFACRGTDFLYRNNGNGTFTNVTAGAGLGDPRYGAAAAWGDYDQDGDLDLYVGNYVQTNNYPNHVPWPNALYRNEGNGTFTDVTAITGVAGAGTTLAVTWTDYDDDGDPDLFVANDFGYAIEPNRVYRNDGPAAGGGWTFTEVSAALGADLAINAMGIAIGDIDRDLDFDYYFSNLGRNVLLRNDPGAFVDVTTQAGVEYTSHPYQPSLVASTWGIGFHDFDQDGWLDLFLTNGYIPGAVSNPALTPNGLYHHDGPSLTFTSVGAAAGIEHMGIGRGAAFGDYDNDGDVDILVGNVAGYPVLFRNDTPNQGRWLRLDPRGRISNRDGQGTRVQADLPGFSLLREVNANSSYLSSSEHTVHFGLGTAAEVERIQVRWPSGVIHRYHHLPINVELPLVEPVVTIDSASTAPATVAQGTTLSMNLVLKNETATSQPVTHFLTIRVAGLEVQVAPWTQSVPAAGTLSFPLSIPIPNGVVTGPPVPVEILWTAFDPGGAVDQWKIDLMIT